MSDDKKRKRPKYENKKREGMKAGNGGIYPPDTTGMKYKKHKSPEEDGRRNNSQPMKRHLIDIEKVREMCNFGCTMREVEDATGFSATAIREAINDHCGLTWAEFFNENNNKFKVSLRRLQMRSAEGDFDENGNKYRLYPSVQMQIWLGKQFLGQSDKSELETSEKASIPQFEWAEAEDVTNQKEIEEKKKQISDEKEEDTSSESED